MYKAERQSTAWCVSKRQQMLKDSYPQPRFDSIVSDLPVNFSSAWICAPCVRFSLISAGLMCKEWRQNMVWSGAEILQLWCVTITFYKRHKNPWNVHRMLHCSPSHPHFNMSTFFQLSYGKDYRWDKLIRQITQIKPQKRLTLSGQVEQDHWNQKSQSLGCSQYQLPLMTITERPLVKGCYTWFLRKKTNKRDA